MAGIVVIKVSSSATGIVAIKISSSATGIGNVKYLALWQVL